jgi:Protein of unknown function (DUF3631)
MKINFKPLTKVFSNLRKRSKAKPAVALAAKLTTNSQASSPAAARLPAATSASTALTLSKTGSPAPTVIPPTTVVAKPKPSELLDSVVSFLRQHLVCDNQRLDVLALWIAHTWTFQSSPTSVYLNVGSAEKQSGKSTCLALLAMLSAEPWLGTGSDPRTVAGKLLTEARQVKSGKLVDLAPPYTILLDNYHHTLGRSERQGLLAMLCSGVSAVQRYAAGKEEYWLFGAKAFAGDGPLPCSLEGKCVPIRLVRKKPTETVARLNSSVRQNATALTRKLQQWADEFALAIAQAATRPPANIPTGIILPELNNSEPLLHIADVVGGTWPERARTAIVAIYSGVEESLSMMALADVRSSFFDKEYPPYLLTRDVLDFFATLEHRPWSGWPKKAGGRLGALLRPFGIRSRQINFPSGKRPKGYVLTDFKDVWERYLPPMIYKSPKDVPALASVPENKF